MSLLTVCLGQARGSLLNAPVQPLLGGVYMRCSPSPCQSHQPSPLQGHKPTTERAPSSCDTSLHNAKLLWWKIPPLVPSIPNHGLLAVEQTTLRQSTSSLPAAAPRPLSCPHRPQQLLCASVMPQDVLAASAFPLPCLGIYSNLSEVVRGA